MSEPSIFTKIINREVPATIRYEDEQFIVFDDVHPQAPVHVLVVPKEPYQSLEKVDTTDTDFHNQLLQVTRTVAQALGIADNYKLHMNVGPQVQAVQHLHLHVMGGWGTQLSADDIEESVADFIQTPVA